MPRLQARQGRRCSGQIAGATESLLRSNRLLQRAKQTFPNVRHPRPVAKTSRQVGLKDHAQQGEVEGRLRSSPICGRFHATLSTDQIAELDQRRSTVRDHFYSRQTRVQFLAECPQ